MAQGERVNRITVSMDGDSAILTLYRTHKRLCIIGSDELGIPSITRSGAKNANVYTAYCKEVIINLLNNGGIEGYYYDPKEESTEDKPRKFDSSGFDERAKMYVAETLTAMDLPYDIKVSDSNEYPKVTDRYKDGSVKYGTTTVMVSIIPKGREGVTIWIPVELKSGQMCKPRTMVLGGTQYSINRTNIDKLIVMEGSHGKTKTV